MSRQIPCVTYTISSNRAVKCSLGCHKALNRAHLGSFPNDDVSSDEMPPNSIIFDASFTLASWSGRPGKKDTYAADPYGD